MNEPRFQIGDRVYLKTSAAIGFLESYLISSIFMKSAGGWQYKIAVSQKPPAEQMVGDTIDLKTEQPFVLDETELIDACEAATMVEANLQKRLTSAQRLRQSICGGTDG